MRLAGVQPGDLVLANVRGLVFQARVVSLDDTAIPGRPIRVDPVSPNITYFHLAATHIRELVERGTREAA